MHLGNIIQSERVAFICLVMFLYNTFCCVQACSELLSQVPTINLSEPWQCLRNPSRFWWQLIRGQRKGGVALPCILGVYRTGYSLSICCTLTWEHQWYRTDRTGFRASSFPLVIRNLDAVLKLWRRQFLRACLQEKVRRHSNADAPDGGCESGRNDGFAPIRL